MFSGMPSIWIVCVTLSRVVPAIAVTIATSAPASASAGSTCRRSARPASTTFRPSRSSAPWLAWASTACSACASSLELPLRIGSACRKSISSSGNRASPRPACAAGSTPSTSAATAPENSPDSERTGRARRLLGAGVDQVGHRLGLRQIELVIEIGAPREFARLGQAHAKRRAGARATSQQQLHAPPGRRGPAARARLRRCMSAARENRARCPVDAACRRCAETGR